MAPKKKWYKSKTVWFNVATGAVYIVQGLQGSTWLSNDVYIGILAVGNGILRWMTNDGIK